MTTHMKQYRRLNKILKTLTADQKLNLNKFLMSGCGPLPEGANLDTILAFLVMQTPEQIEQLVLLAETHVDEKQSEDVAPERGDSVMLNFSIKLTGDLDPKSVIVISRDITDAEADRIVLQEVNIDNGNFLPVDADRVAGILQEYANTIVERQNEINQHDK